MVLGGALLVAALALVLELLMALAQRMSVPRGLRSTSTAGPPAEPAGRGADHANTPELQGDRTVERTRT
jgi:osmoprotectant transport system permease protein